MKKIISIILLLSFVLSLTACVNSTEPKEISCEDIIKAYEDAGYYVTHGAHKDEAESSQLCYIKASISEDSGSDYIYFITCFTEEQAKEAAEADKYNLAIWLYAAVCGESRWLKSGAYGKIEYSYYNPKLIKPFNELIK
ncbi:MAG: hypothetical protein ACI3XL_01260 [Eubacteriales bacterium]